ncbi:MAG: hypothetical protein ACPG4K_13020, partial [Haloferula sp.]
MTAAFKWMALATGVAVLGACSESPSETKISRVPREPIPKELVVQFDGQRAYDHVKTLVDIGPRPPASEGFEKQLQYLEKELSAHGWISERQSFRAATPDGPVDFTNLLARHQSAPKSPNSLPVLIGGHI